MIDETRSLLARLFNFADPSRIILTANTTDSLNLALHGLLKPGDHVITTTMEHNAIVRPLRALERQGVEVTRVPCSRDGSLDAARLIELMRANTRLVAMIHASNVSGTVMPVEKIAPIVREREPIY